MIEPRDFYFIRHGETDWNREHRGMGQKDIPLNAKGLEQAHTAADILKNEAIRTICVSPLIRARVTAEIIARKSETPIVEIPELKECGWGEYEGQIKGKWLEDWIKGADYPGAEKYQDFLFRALSGINKALQMEGPVLVVAHGGVFWAVQEFGKLGARFDLPNATPIYLRAPFNSDLPWSHSVLSE